MLDTDKIFVRGCQIDDNSEGAHAMMDRQSVMHGVCVLIQFKFIHVVYNIRVN
jgi:hypothetical protein